MYICIYICIYIYIIIENIYLSIHGELECQNYNYNDIKYYKNKERIISLIYCSLASYALYPKNIF